MTRIEEKKIWTEKKYFADRKKFEVEKMIWKEMIWENVLKMY